MGTATTECEELSRCAAAAAGAEQAEAPAAGAHAADIMVVGRVGALGLRRRSSDVSLLRR